MDLLIKQNDQAALFHWRVAKRVVVEIMRVLHEADITRMALVTEAEQ